MELVVRCIHLKFVGDVANKTIPRFYDISPCGIILTAILLRPTSVPFIVYPLARAFAALAVMPFASMPLAIAWNRHR